MREILFRGKRKDNGEWVKGYYYESRASGCFILTPKIKTRKKDGIIIEDAFDVYEVIPETVGQYTGLQDKNGNRLFEGDISIIHSPNIGDDEGYFVIVWDDESARFVLRGETLECDFDYLYSTNVEVIGNIHDNPELLEVE